MRPSVPILLLLPVLDALLLVPMSRAFGAMLWFWLGCMAIAGLWMLHAARHSMQRRGAGLPALARLQAMLDHQHIVLAGFLLIWPGVLTDLAAFGLLLTTPATARISRWEHPLMLESRALGGPR